MNVLPDNYWPFSGRVFLIIPNHFWHLTDNPEKNPAYKKNPENYKNSVYAYSSVTDYIP
jgi:hypothetical protein